MVFGDAVSKFKTFVCVLNQFIVNWLKFETCPSSLRNSGMANDYPGCLGFTV